MTARRRLLLLAVAAAVVALGPCASAQYDEDDQTRDHEDADRLYLERHVPPDDDTPGEDEEDDAAAFLARAERLIRDRNYHSAAGRACRVQTDDPRLDATAAAALLDAFRSWFDGFWQGGVELAPRDEPSRVFLFYSFHKFNELLEGDHRYRTHRPSGHYGALFDVVTLHTDAGDPGDLGDALVHEAAHQLVDRRIFTEGFAPSRWVSEGLAHYFGFTYADESGEFHRGVVGGKSAELIRGGRGGGSDRRATLQSLRKTFKRAGPEAGALVDRVVSIRDPNRFYGEQAPLHYSVSWLLVHYLLDGAEGKHSDGFFRYLELEKQGRGGSEALYREIGSGPEQLGAELAAHLKRLSVK